jgi:hypothetical protein
MGFFDRLQSNPGGSSIYGNPGPADLDYTTPLSVDQRLRERDMNDYMKKANFMSDLSLRQNRLRQVYGGENQNPSAGMNTVFKDNSIPPLQMAKLKDEQTKTGIAGRKADTAAALGEEKINLGQEKQDLDTKKNQNIYDTKQADLQRKHDEAQAKLGLAEKALQNKQNDAKTLSDYHDAQMKAAAARHDLEMSQKDKQHQASLDEMKRLHDAQIANMKGNQNVTTEEDTNAEGTKRTKKTTKGSQNQDNDPLGILQ